MFRTQPRGFRWLVGGFALLAGCAFVLRFVTDADKGALVMGLVCLLLAAYWLIFDSEPPGERESPDHEA
ncbi:MAG TPA: hypothetical protein VMB79_00110 [Jatrophihabitans sp.]|nr:hypothetical protein [Jatrophihabitans sp.]